MTLRHLLPPVLNFFVMCSVLCVPALGLAADLPPGPTVTVMKTSPQLEADFERLRRTFSTRGTSAVADLMKGELADEEQLKRWREFAKGTQVRVVDVHVHPNEKEAVQWMNHRFARMGVPALSFNGIEDANLPDPTAIDYETIGPRKWLRYLGGPGVAAIAFYFGLPPIASTSAGDYLYLLIPTATVGVTTIALELVFASPKLNNAVWKHVWKFGGAIGGRITNLTVNFLFGLALWGSDVLGAQIPTLFGAEAVHHASQSFPQAVTAAAIGAVTFHLAMGQFQTDVAKEEERGSITANTRYGLETTGSVVVNGARVSSWIMGPDKVYLAYIAQAGFFLLKTLPQLLKTTFADRLTDRRIERVLHPERTVRHKFVETCADALAGLQLINVPRLQK